MINGLTMRTSNKPALSGTDISLIRPAPLRREAIACTPVPIPRMNAWHMKTTKPPMPTAAKAAFPRVPTMAVSTKFNTFWEIIPPITGSASSRMRFIRDMGKVWLAECFYRNSFVYSKIGRRPTGPIYVV